VSFFLRLIGITNAALWFGSTLFLELGIMPAFSSGEMAHLLPASHAGAAAQLVWERYFVVQYWCGGVGLAHLVAESLYTGKPWRRWNLYLVLLLLALGIFEGQFVEPRLERLHLEIFGMRSTPQQRQSAKASFRVWENCLLSMNYFLTAGLVLHLLEVNTPGMSTRLAGAGKFRG
jgi:hypothetical protein